MPRADLGFAPVAWWWAVGAFTQQRVTFDFDALDVSRQLPKDLPVLPVEKLSPPLPSGYQPPAPEPLPGLPFFVHRSTVGGELPVYSEFKNKKTEVIL